MSKPCCDDIALQLVANDEQCLSHILLHKKGDVSNPRNYRMIAVSKVMYRIYANVLKGGENRLVRSGKKGFLTPNSVVTQVAGTCNEKKADCQYIKVR
eukprot:1144490-Pelagomonas_calceolata.AAC.1